jgi:hypothetical protein
MRAKLLGALLLAGCVVLAGIGMTSAQDKKPVATEKKVEGVKAEKYTPASTIDFGGALGLSFPSLTSLGGRIEAARRAPDPVALTADGLELAAAEKVSGKKADLTSETVLKEAVDLAKVRSHSQELRMVAELLKDDPAAKDLRAEADKAATREREEEAKSPEAGRGASYLRVVNRTHEGLDIYVNGEFLGHVREHQRETFPIHMRHEHVRLFAKHHHRTWGPAHIEGHYDTYTWELDD